MKPLQIWCKITLFTAKLSGEKGMIGNLPLERKLFFVRSRVSACAYELANAYALERLERELPPILTYHAPSHTRDEVVPAVERLANLEGIGGESLELMRTAAYFHDIGFVRQHADHERAGAQLAADALPRFGFTAFQIDLITGMIMATQIPQTPRTLLEAILADADLDVLGRKDFWARNQDLKAEAAACGCRMTDQAWYNHQLNFLQSHTYFTNAARILREPRKQQNIALLAEKLTQD